MNAIEFPSKSEEDTAEIAAKLAAAIPEGTTVALVGTLGAGKTQFVRSFAAALGVSEENVTSPTYILQQEYVGEKRILHMDVYRLNDEDEFLEMGPEEIFESNAVVFIEWADRIADFLPDERIDLSIQVTEDGERLFTVTPTTEPLYHAIAQQCSVE